MMENRVVGAVLVCMISIFATMFTLFFVGEVIDRFQDSVSNINIDYGDVKFPRMALAINNTFNYIFSIPLFMVYVWIFWMFKVVIFDHKYSKEERYEY